MTKTYQKESKQNHLKVNDCKQYMRVYSYRYYTYAYICFVYKMFTYVSEPAVRYYKMYKKARNKKERIKIIRAE